MALTPLTTPLFCLCFLGHSSRLFYLLHRECQCALLWTPGTAQPLCAHSAPPNAGLFLEKQDCHLAHRCQHLMLHSNTARLPTHPVHWPAAESHSTKRKRSVMRWVSIFFLIAPLESGPLNQTEQGR
eukprot:Pompholyxophrys_punicea_v1_NODE_89_length_3617_cov_47.365806.p3 type:complete len:127 gc:universal NODE_89_length_3617_cov_47.365806:2403-2023(-)